MGFAAIFVSNFMVQAVMRAEPALRERALALIEGTPPLWSVAAMSEAARKSGIRIGMTKAQVEQFRGIEIRPRPRGQEKVAHAALLDLGWSFSPRVEDAGPDTIVVDLAGLGSLFGSEEEIAQEMARRARGVGLNAQVATAEKIDVAILAARGFAGVTVVSAGEEAKRLGCLPVGVLAPTMEACETLERWGIHSCGEMGALPAEELSERLGQEGVRLRELARGESVRSLTLAEAEIHFEEEMELEDAVEDLEPLSFLLGRMLDGLCARLEARALAVSAVRVRFELDAEDEDRTSGVKTPDKKKAFMSDLKVRPPKNWNHTLGEEFNRPSGTGAVLGNGSRHSAALRAGLSTTAAPRLPDNSGQKTESKIYERVLSLPVAMRNSKMLLNLLRLHLQSEPPKAPILKIFLAAEPARPRVAQGDLYLPSAPDPEKLELTVARLANLVGDASVGSPELVDTHRPDKFRMRRFFAAGSGRDEPQRRRGRREEKERNTKDSKAKTAFRIFRTAMPVKVELREGCPVRVDIRGMRGDVVAASGPWRSSGDWWREDAWRNDEWDLEIRFEGACDTGLLAANEDGQKAQGLYRIFYDAIRGGWFVRGIYD
ncbi:MAG TPA: DNA polymerase Y family protein [Candidatus Limnocylindrales bacterium]|nr:DNA polymerase Y family protein [Candidatus Limnocylindrales bacterium]